MTCRPSLNPGDRASSSPTFAQASTPRQTDAAIAARRGARAGLARRSRPATGPGCCARFAAAVDAAREELAALEVAERRAHRSATPAGRPATSATCSTYYSGAPERLFGRQIPVAGGLDVTFHEPLGVVGRDRAVELPDADRRLGFRPGAGRRQHRRAQARRAHPADRDAARRARAGGRAPRGRLPGAPGQGRGRRPALRRPPGRPQGRASPARPRSGKQVMAGCAEQVKRVTLELGGKSANIVFADADLERAAATAPYARLRQRRPGLLRAVADPGPAHGLRPSSWSCSSRP